jgi:hypothetical protein
MFVGGAPITPQENPYRCRSCAVCRAVIRNRIAAEFEYDEMLAAEDTSGIGFDPTDGGRTLPQQQSQAQKQEQQQQPKTPEPQSTRTRSRTPPRLQKTKTYTEDLTMKIMQTQTMTKYTEAKINHKTFRNKFRS